MAAAELRVDIRLCAVSQWDNGKSEGSEKATVVDLTDAGCVAIALHPLTPMQTQVAEHTSNTKRLSEFSMVFYNNVLSIGPVLLLVALTGEYKVRGGRRMLKMNMIRLCCCYSPTEHLGGCMGYAPGWPLPLHFFSSPLPELM